jgi:plasmid stability protein
MGQLIVRKIDDDTKQRLKQRAVRHGVSMEEEIRTILQNAVLRDEGKEIGLGSEIAALFEGIGIEGEPLEEFPDSEIRPANFDE